MAEISPLEKFRAHVSDVLSNYEVAVAGYDPPKTFTKFGLPIVDEVLERSKDLDGVTLAEIEETNKCGTLRLLQLSSAEGVEMKFGLGGRAAGFFREPRMLLPSLGVVDLVACRMRSVMKPLSTSSSGESGV